MAPVALKRDAPNRTPELLPRHRADTSAAPVQGPTTGEIMTVTVIATEQDPASLTSPCRAAPGVATLTDQLQAVAASLRQLDFGSSDAATWIALDTALASVHVALVMLDDVAVHVIQADARTAR